MSNIAKYLEAKGFKNSQYLASLTRCIAAMEGKCENFNPDVCEGVLEAYPDLPEWTTWVSRMRQEFYQPSRVVAAAYLVEQAMPGAGKMYLALLD